MATTAILAAGAGDVLPVLFVLIAIASGIINFVKERKAAAEREAGNAGRGNPNRELQSEIDAFLQEVSPDDSEPARPARQSHTQRQRRQRANSDEEAERRRRARARRERTRKQAAVEKRKRESVRDRNLDTSGLSEVSSRHEVANRHVDSKVEDRHLEDRIDGPSQAMPNQAVGAQTSSLVTDLLQRPGGIRDAILLNEILGPPLANRPDRKR